MSTAKVNSPALIAYNVTENNKKTDWMRIGAAWPNKKGGFQMNLEWCRTTAKSFSAAPEGQGGQKASRRARRRKRKRKLPFLFYAWRRCDCAAVLFAASSA